MRDTQNSWQTQNSLAMKFNLSFGQFAASMKRMRGKSLFSIMNVSLVWIDYFRNGCSIIHYRDRLMTHENVMESRVSVKMVHMHLLSDNGFHIKNALLYIMKLLLDTVKSIRCKLLLKHILICRIQYVSSGMI